MDELEQKIAEFFGKSVDEVQQLSDELLCAMKVLCDREDYMGLHHLGYVFWQKKWKGVN